MNRILITGGSGLLGLSWALATRNQFEVHLGLHSRRVSPAGTVPSVIEIDSIESTVCCLKSLKPDLVVHTAGLTSVEKCQTDPVMAFHYNVTLALNVALACEELCIRLVHISTDHLFEGSGVLSDEDEVPSPRNVYGKTKAAAEMGVLAAHSNCLVIRTNFYGWGTSYRRSYSDYILHPLRAGSTLMLFEDVFFTPVLAESLALAAMRLVQINQSGIVNLVGDTRISKFDFGVRLAEEFGLDRSLIKPVKLASRPDLVTRPLDMSLSNQKAGSLLGHPLCSLDLDLRRLREQEEQGLSKELSIL
jgi:dTDP-4-dehydrorhamnose reductase